MFSAKNHDTNTFDVAVAKNLIANQHDIFIDNFGYDNDIENTIYEKCLLIDRIISQVWHQYVSNTKDELALVAVGGYGRAELFPFSDIDLMILSHKPLNEESKKEVSAFIACIWDIGLEVGHSVRTLKECIDLSYSDLTIFTTLLEHRLIVGPNELVANLKISLYKNKRLWSPPKFFTAKQEEQHRRHKKYHDTAYNLEPSVKGGMGGLRDIQLIGWIGRRLYQFTGLDGLYENELLTKGQLILLKNSQKFLWKVRFALHLITQRKEDRLLFEYQVKVAKILGYNLDGNRGVEMFMQRYYQTVMEVSRLNDIVMCLFEESFLPRRKLKAKAIDAYFEIKNGFLEIKNYSLFAADPSLILTLFSHLENNIDLRGIGPRTVGVIKKNLWLIDDDFRSKKTNKDIFLQILRAPTGVTRTLKYMNAYGVLGAYIPSFSKIIGRMQFDLFHAYTVDAHTLFVVENLRRFSLEKFNNEFPTCSNLMQSLEKPELAYLSGLFHDIAKGRGGNHSELGAKDAKEFCEMHGFTKYESNLVSWLVLNHLLLSMTAQKKDLNDPEVIKNFASKVGDELHLTYLYLLTVADVRGTNPKLWNSWKDSLFRELFEKTRTHIRRGLDEHIISFELIKERKLKSLETLSSDHPNLSINLVESCWNTLTESFFLTFSSNEIAWITGLLIAPQKSLINFNDSIDDPIDRVLIYAPSGHKTFARSTAIMDQMGFNVLNINFNSVKNYNLDVYYINDAANNQAIHKNRADELIERLNNYMINQPTKKVAITRKISRRVNSFEHFVHINFLDEIAKNRTILEVNTIDRPGLLHAIANIFEGLNITMIDAKISTLGESVDDIFFIQSSEKKSLTENDKQELYDSLYRNINNLTNGSLDE
jgi:[protein-PII] uridylyltransferase